MKATLLTIATAVMFLIPIGLTAQTVRRPAPTPTTPGHSKLDSPVVRAMQLKGVKVKNNAGEEVGKIYDLVIDTKTGEAAYVALSVGGFLGVGDKLFAIPYDAFTFVASENAPAKNGRAKERSANKPTVTENKKLSDVVATLDVSKDTLKNAKGFDQNAWPNMADEAWRSENDKAYTSLHRRYGNKTVQVGNLARASELSGLNVHNGNNQTVGEIDDLIIDDADGHVRYVALSVGGFLGVGNKLFAIPLQSFDIRKDSNDKVTAQLPVTKESFKNINGFDKDHWPNIADKTWREHNDASYQSWSHGT
jgi:sporulation protein YlmC with PRC-barrel domain